MLIGFFNLRTSVNVTGDERSSAVLLRCFGRVIRYNSLDVRTKSALGSDGGSKLKNCGLNSRIDGIYQGSTYY